MSAVSVGIFLARMPPWTAGCRVFTLPPSISGCPVSFETSLPHNRHTDRLEKPLRWLLKLQTIFIFHFHSKDQLSAPTSRPIQHHAGFQLCPLKPPETAPHPPAFWRSSPVQFYPTRSKVLRGKTDSRLTKHHCYSVFDRKQK